MYPKPIIKRQKSISVIMPDITFITLYLYLSDQRFDQLFFYIN